MTVRCTRCSPGASRSVFVNLGRIDMAIELSGGLNPDFEYFLPAPPDNPELRDSASIWVMNDDGRLAFSRVTVDAIGDDWDHPRVQVNLALADGRAFRLWSAEPSRSAFDPEGRPAVLGAGPLQFHCTEPFRRWRVEFEGCVEQTTSAAQMRGVRGGKPVNLAFHLDAEMAAPPWLMGGMSAEMASRMRSSDAGALMGGLRYEQLCRVSGHARIDGEDFPVAGSGMRVRRQGVRNMGTAVGHCQHSALFPSGRAFGAIAFAPGPDGRQSFNEGFVFLGDGALIPARVSAAPWMTRLGAVGEVVSVDLETDRGPVSIEGSTTLSTFDHHLFEMADSSVLHQGAARYIWNGEETIGLVERCALRQRLHS